MRDQVFISYCHEDKDWLEGLQKALKPLMRKGVVNVWDDTHIQAGQKWGEEIKTALSRAKVAVLLVSLDFLASDFIDEGELPPLLNAAAGEDLTIIWVPVGHSGFADTEIAKYQAAFDPARPLSTLTPAEADEALVEISKKIIKAATANIMEAPKPFALSIENTDHPVRRHPPLTDADTGEKPEEFDSANAVVQEMFDDQRRTQRAAENAPTPAASAGSAATVVPPPPASPAAVAKPAATSPPAPSSPEAVSLEMPEGPVRIDSPFYIHPAGVARCYEEIEKPGALIRIKSPKAMGKSSLMVRLLAHAEGKGYRTVRLKLEEANQKTFTDPDSFMKWFCAAVGKEVGLSIRTEEHWDDMYGANTNATGYFEHYLLQPGSAPLVLAIDNFDRVFNHAAIETDFFSLLRSWHEDGRSIERWEQLHLIIAHAQDYLQKDINQSPFNVGLPVELGEFSSDQVRELVRRHGQALDEAQVDQLIDLVGGHPYLVRMGLYQLAQGLGFDAFLRTAATEAGLYGNHLLGLRKPLEDHPELGTALSKVLESDGRVMLRPEDAFKLDSLGLLVREENHVKLRCRLYLDYFVERPLSY